jgi:adenylate cyclase
MWQLASHPALRAILAGLGAAIGAAFVILWQPGFIFSARETTIDAVSQLQAAAGTESVVVVDIDSASTRALGNWPWPRQQLANLIAKIASSRPSAIAVDIVLSGNCGNLDPGNEALAQVMTRVPVALGFVVADQETPLLPQTPVALRQPVDIPLLWRSGGAELPCPEFIASAQGLGTVSLAGDQTATVRTVPGIIGIGSELYPGLAVEALRLSAEAGAVIVSGTRDAVLSVGDLQAHLDSAGELRLHASTPEQWTARSLAAKDVMATTPSAFAGKIVLIGVSLPQLGSLRPTAATPLAPSTEIQADIVSGLLGHRLPWRPAIAPAVEVIAMLLAAALAVSSSLWLKPAMAALATIVLASATAIAAAFAYHRLGLVFDPLSPALGVIAAGLASGVSQYSASRAAETAIRRSFEQRLPPAIVARLSKAGAKLKLESEERIVTALFTDIEGFTTLTSNAGPHALIPLLDGYFDGVTRIIAERGGMIDKIVGDAAHAFFNMPLELANHQARALECAEAIILFSEEYRARPEVRRYAFGRTRIGIETGPALVGDVGAFGKFDYSAHGDAVNLAARLQEANKLTGTSILVGPGLQSSNPPGWEFISHGIHQMRGIGPVKIFTPMRASST